MHELTARWASEAEIATWDALVAANPIGGEFLHTSTFARAKSSVGWTPRYVVFERASASAAGSPGSAAAPRSQTTSAERVSVALILEKRVPFFGRFWYATKTPPVRSVEEFSEHAEALDRFARSHGNGVFLVTLDPPILRTPESEAAIAALPLSQSGTLKRYGDIQGNTHTVIVDLEQDDDTLIGSFEKKCRNAIRRAERDGVTVRQYDPTPETFAHMHRLMGLVGGGKGGLQLRSQDYTERMWGGFAAAGQGRFFGIDVDGTPALMAFVIRVGDHVTYKDGGSERQRLSPGASNYLQWHIMRQLRDEGGVDYDMFGTAPPEAGEEHAMYHVGRFKMSFAERIAYVGGYDLLIKPSKYRAWKRFGEGLFTRYHRKRFNDLALY